ncbi:MAG TPA: zinc transporter ZupT [bacterium]|nr:zinc transporter ZupT [bacterium]
MEENSFLFAFALTVFAGLSTGVGSVMAFFSKSFNHKFLAGALGFSAGVMIYVSLVEIFAKAKDSLVVIYGTKQGYWITVLAYFVGMGVIALIDKMVPSFENPHEVKVIKSDAFEQDRKKKLMRMGVFSALAIAIHNFPEGLATFIGALQYPAMGISIAVAVAIHNIPEGIAVSVPIYYATGSKKRAFFYSFLSGFAEPVGAVVGFFILKQFFSEATFGVVFAAVAGIMVYISLDELLPTAEEYGKHHVSIAGLIAGMLVIALSLVLFA